MHPCREAGLTKRIRDRLLRRQRAALGSRSHPSRIGPDGNRTYEIVPAGGIFGGALLIHGLTDSPYSMRAVGETLKASGYYGLALRMPFTLDDDVYGRNPRPSSFDVVRLGTLSPRGERAVLTVPLETLMRVSSNPFFPYLAARLTAFIQNGKTSGREPSASISPSHDGIVTSRTR